MVSDSSARGFEFSSLGIGEVLKLHRLRVPPYQREYAWGSEEISQLFSDFSNAKSEGKEYFLGTIVTIDSPNGHVLEIVDGQQRLTTTAILLAAIRNFLRTIPSATLLVESINNEFLSTIDRVAGQRVPRLQLNIDDNVFFENILTDEPNRTPIAPSRQSHRLLNEAKRIATEHVANLAKVLSPADLHARFNDWLEFLEHNATVVLLQAQNASQAFKMFETLNDRGMKTNQADLVKSYLLGQSGNRVTEAIAKWSSIRDNLEEISDEDRLINFLRHAFIATRSFVRADEIYEETQKTVRGEAQSISYLAELERFSRVYVASYNPSAEFWASHPASTLNALRVINKFDIKPIRPLVLSLCLSFNQRALEPAFELLAALGVRLLIASATRSGTNEQTFSTAAQSVSRQEITTASALKTALARVIVSDADFKEIFTSARSSKADYARYYLRAIEAAKTAGSQPWYVPNDDQAAITLEHILPRANRSTGWEAFDEDEADRYGKRLGNLCLLQRQTNSSIDNSSFLAKKPALSNSPYHFTNHIADYHEWSPQTVEERQKYMAEWAVKAWPI